MLIEEQSQFCAFPAEAKGSREAARLHWEEVIQSFDNDQYLFKAGETRPEVFFIRSGAVSVTRYYADGQIARREFAFRGQFVGTGRLIRNRMSARAKLPTTVRVYSPTEWADLAEANNRVRANLIAETQREFAELRNDHLSATQRLSLTERIANFLLATSNMAQSEGRPANLWNEEIYVDQLAQVLDADPKSTADALEPLESAGALYSNPGGRLRIDSRADLERLTGSTQ